MKLFQTESFLNLLRLTRHMTEMRIVDRNDEHTASIHI